MKNPKGAWCYRLVCQLLRWFYPHPKLIGLENLPESSALLIGNHSQIHGPIVSELFFPFPHDTWCIGDLIDPSCAAEYCFQDFWSGKPPRLHPFYRLLSKLIQPLCLALFQHADIIPVYHDSRLKQTYRGSVTGLTEGRSMVIFPEMNEKTDTFLYHFQDKFVDTARFYYRKTGKIVSFVPFYLTPKRHEVHFGKPIPFDPNAPIAEERERIVRLLREEIIAMASALPRHRIVPYPNIPKSQYPWSR